MLPEFDRQTTKWCAGAQSGFFLVIDPGKFCQDTNHFLFSPCFANNYYSSMVLRLFKKGGEGTSSCLNL